ncbi:MAG: hypothetical protein J6T96_05650 [Bacteroidales bacterium]|nr:hypothetical protein [Bacteroidales bacterium]
MEYITINLADNNLNQIYDKTAGASGENWVKGVTFIVPEQYINWDAFIDIENPAGEKYRQELLVTDQSSGTITYDFSQNDLKAKGRLYLDLVLVNDNQIAKPFRGEFAVKRAVCASDEPEVETSTIVTSELVAALQDFTALYPILSEMGETENEVLTYKGETYITESGLADAVSTFISARVENEKLILTYEGGNG